MAKDVKRPRSRGNGKHGGSLLTGLLAGLIIGVIAAVGVALYVNRGANPFNDKTTTSTVSGNPATAQPASNQAPEILRPASSPDEVAPPVLADASVPAQKASGPERFDFYTMLPALNEQSGKPVPQAVSKPVASAPAKTVVEEKAWLQAGAFQNEQDADNLKAKLALLGIEARIQTQEIPGKGLWHRVRIGPFNKTADLEKVRAQLKGNGIDSAVVKG